MLTGENGLITKATAAKEATEQAAREEELALKQIEGLVDEESGYNEAKAVNEPKITTGMIPIKWNGSSWVVCAEDDDNWYNYDSTNKQWANIMLSDGTYKSTSVTVGQVVAESELGSMYVWVPRYAYKINGVKDIDVTFLKGTSNIGTDGVTYTTSESVDTSVTPIVHPGFSLGSLKLSGIWVAKFEASGTTSDGTAVGNASSESSTPQAPDTTTIAKSLPNKISWRHITVGESENRCMAITTTAKESYGIKNVNSHLIKNDEWGAVAYLCYSDYGSVPQINAAGSLVSGSHYYDLYTGQGPQASGNESRYERTDATHNYDTALGMLASTTGNVTGIYDMNGGAWERVAAYLDNGNGNLNAYGKSADGNTKYFENGQLKAEYVNLWNAYEVSAEEKNNVIKIDASTTMTQSQLWSETNLDEKYHTARYRITKATFDKMALHKGIGVNEVTSGETPFSFYSWYNNSSNNIVQGWFKTVANAVANTQSLATSWDGDYVLIGYSACPFVMRGGGYSNGSGAGVLYSGIASGYAYGNSGFRSVLVA